jgi:putative transposase
VRRRRLTWLASMGSPKRRLQLEEAVDRSDARQRHAEGHRLKKMMTPVARREAVAHLRQRYEVSQRRACRALGVDRTSIRYLSRRADDGPIRARLRELAAHATKLRTRQSSYAEISIRLPSGSRQ